MNAQSDSELYDDDQLDYDYCEFPGTRLRFRGPCVSFETPFVAALGGTETFGKYVSDPFPALLGTWLNVQVMNFGVPQGGLSLLSDEAWLLDKASQAELTILQVPGAQNMSNRLYSVHGRRNDRFISVSAALREIFPAVDFAEINFTGHLLEVLYEASRPGFDVVVEELRAAWVRRMRRVLTNIQSDVLLLWISDRRPDDTESRWDEREPTFVDRSMLDALSDVSAGLVEYVHAAPASVEGMVFPEREERAARSMLGPVDHAGIAEALASAMPAIRSYLSPEVPRAQVNGS